MQVVGGRRSTANTAEETARDLQIMLGLGGAESSNCPTSRSPLAPLMISRTLTAEWLLSLDVRRGELSPPSASASSTAATLPAIRTGAKAWQSEIDVCCSADQAGYKKTYMTIEQRCCHQQMWLQSTPRCPAEAT